MKYVLESCVAIKWVSPEPDSDNAIAVRDGGHDLLAPDIFRFEIGNVLSKAVRRKKLTADDAAKALQLIDNDIPALADSHDLFTRAMAISVDVWCSIWDAFYIALAEQEGCELLTADARLIAAVQHKFGFLVDLSTIKR